MNIYDQIAVFVCILAILGAYKLISKKSKNSEDDLCHTKPEDQPTLTKSELQPFLEPLNLVAEEKIRKLWLVSLFAVTAISILSALTTYFIDGSFLKLSANTSPIFSVLFGILKSCLSLVPWFWITYYCAYKKRGTAWLTLTMILLPITYLISIVIKEQNFDLIFISIEAFYWINCLRLHRINKAREYQILLAVKAKYGSAADGFRYAPL